MGWMPGESRKLGRQGAGELQGSESGENYYNKTKQLSASGNDFKSKQQMKNHQCKKVYENLVERIP